MSFLPKMTFESLRQKRPPSQNRLTKIIRAGQLLKDFYGKLYCFKSGNICDILAFKNTTEKCVQWKVFKKEKKTTIFWPSGSWPKTENLKMQFLHIMNEQTKIPRGKSSVGSCCLIDSKTVYKVLWMKE